VGSNQEIELDLYSEDKKLALEAQGQWHYFDVYNYGDCESFGRRDAEKALACSLAGIRLVEVPYWWDMQLDSLEQSLSSSR